MHLSARWVVTAPCVPHCLTFWGRIWSMIGSPCQTMAAVRWHVAAIISELHQNAKTVSVSDSCSTLPGCSYPNLTHNPTMSSSLKELSHNRVQSPWVVTTMKIWFPISVSSPRVGSISTFPLLFKYQSTQVLSLSSIIKLKEFLFIYI